MFVNTKKEIFSFLSMDIAYQVKESKSKDRLIADRILSAQNSGILKCTLYSDTLINRQIGILNSFDVPYSNRFTKGPQY